MTTGFQSVCTYPRLYSCGEKVWPQATSVRASQPWKLWSVYLWTLSVFPHHAVAILRRAAASESSRWELLLPRGPSLLVLFPGLKLSTFSPSLFCYRRLCKPELILGSCLLNWQRQTGQAFRSSSKCLLMHMITFWRACDNMHNYCCRLLRSPSISRGPPLFGKYLVCKMTSCFSMLENHFHKYTSLASVTAPWF